MKRVRVVSVPVSDQERAKRFYTEQVGLVVLAESTFGPGMHWIQVGPEGGEASLTLVTWFDSMPAGSLRGLVIDCDDLNADYEAMLERGVPFLAPPAEMPGGVFASFLDPDGNQIALRQDTFTYPSPAA
ncbi:VOC family protein [Curtobacterium ammoniigenes]|uniref:VOC family protein n=1 Tax=Curtobacterium ammoniigenes TaxID=395387 RepID=UPI00083461A0|nr:VOC family protein [Curtobacterium ammoniigenes]